MKPLTPEQLKTCDYLLLIPHYPREQHLLVIKDIERFSRPVDRGRGLQWLVDAARIAMAKGWVDQLRGLWCTKFPPADGLEADCFLAGHSPSDSERDEAYRHEELKRLTLAGPDPHKYLSGAVPRKLQ